MASSRGTSNGPDFEDLTMTLTALEEFHHATITLTFSLPVRGVPGLLCMTARAERKMGKRGALQGSVSRSHVIGSGDPALTAAAGYRLLLELDRDCGQMWAQEELFAKA